MQANKKSGAGRLILLFLLIALATSFLFWQLAGSPAGWFRWGKPDPLAQTLQLIQERYVDEIPPAVLKSISLDSIANLLDPHSAYLDPISLRRANEDLSNHYAGVGIGFARIRDTVTVSYVYPNSPSERAGIQTGDQLLAIGKRSLLGQDLSYDSIRLLVRGPVGTEIHLTVATNGKRREVAVKRAEIPTPGVTSAYLINDSTGYIKLIKFSEGSYRESVRALDSLKGLGMRSLILDLRSNGGGFLQEAVELADEFLSDDRLIVYTEGAHLKKRSYFCKRPGLFEKGNLTVLMNEHSASASEVLAGALQDWCRATIVGRRSFGKGLVQEQYDLSNQGALRLTVARYYTPLGRCIQRPYQKNRSQTSTSDPEKNHPPIRIYQNVCGDTLYAGGGIEADIQVPFAPIRMQDPSTEQFLQSPEIVVWAYRYYIAHKNRMDTLLDMSQWALRPPEKELHDFLLQQVFSNTTVLSAGDWEQIGWEINAQIARIRKGEQEYIRIKNLRDPYLHAARQNHKSP